MIYKELLSRQGYVGHLCKQAAKFIKKQHTKQLDTAGVTDPGHQSNFWTSYNGRDWTYTHSLINTGKPFI